jgi:hypothetical protein
MSWAITDGTGRVVAIKRSQVDMKIDVCCKWCEKSYELNVLDKGFALWKKGELIQDAMPELSADDRELLISGTCGKCWNVMFGISELD